MKKIVFILLIVLVLAGCAKGDSSKEQKSKTSEIAKSTESKTETITEKKTEEEMQTSSEIISEVVENSSSADNFLSEEDAIKYGKKLREIFEDIKINMGYPENTKIINDMIGDLDNDGTIDAIISFNYDEGAYGLYYLKLEENGLDKQIGTWLEFEDINYLGFEIVKIKGIDSKVPILSVDFEGENGSGFNLYYLSDASLGMFFENYDRYFMGYRYLDDLDSDGVKDCYCEDETSVSTLGESVSKRIDFVEYDKRVSATAIIMSDKEPKTPEDVVKKYIKLSYLKKSLSEDGYDVSDIDEMLKNISSDNMGDYFAWTPNLLINTFANVDTGVIEFNQGKETVNKKGNKVYEVNTTIKGTYYAKYLGEFENARTVDYEVEEIDGKLVLVDSKLVDLDWDGMNEVYEALYFANRDESRDFEVIESLKLEKGKKLNVKTEYIYRDDEEIVAHIYIDDEDGYATDGMGLDYYFLERASNLYILDSIGVDKYMLTGELDENSLFLFSYPFEEFNYVDNTNFAKASVEKIQDEYICKLETYDNVVYGLKFKKEQGIVGLDLLYGDGEVILKAKVLE